MIRYPWLITSAALLLGAALSTLSFILDESGDYAYQFGLLATVRASATVFLIVFVSGPLYRITRAGWLRPVLANRRYLGISFAILHTFHLAFILLWMQANPGLATTQVLIGGGAAYFLMALMALTSNNWSVAHMGKGWGRLHTVAAYYICAIMFITFIGHDYLVARLFTALFLAALILRLFATWKTFRAS